MWRARTPREHPRWSLPSTQGTSGLRSSCGHPLPARGLAGAVFAGGDLTDLLGGYRLLGSLVQLLDGLLVEAQILLAADQDDGQALAEVQDLGDPLGRC